MNNFRLMLGCTFITAICLLPSGVIAMTAVEETRVLVPAQQIVYEQEGKIVLLSWDDQYLRTSQGTIFTSGIEIVDHANIDKKQLPTMSRPPEVRFTLENNQVVQVDIYPSN